MKRNSLTKCFLALLGLVIWTLLLEYNATLTCTRSKIDILVENHQNSTVILQSTNSTENATAVAPMLVVCVFSRPEASYLRNSSRNTWMKKFKDTKDILFKFMIGTGGLDNQTLSALNSEFKTYGDLVLLDGHNEEYGAHCTEKLMLTFQWIINHTNATFVMKTDDDCYIRLQCLISILKKMDLHDKPFFLGKIIWNEPPNVSGKWKETGWNLTKDYLPFAYGSGYVLLRSLIVEIVASDKAFPLRRYNNEDVTLGVWLAPYNISYINMERIEVRNDGFCKEGVGAFPVIHCFGSPECMHKVHRCQYVLE